MRNPAFVALILLALAPLAAFAEDSTLKFQGGVGVHPVSNIAGTANADGTFPNVTRNIVREVNPAGQIWVLGDRRARVKADGSIRVDGRGLLVAGGNGIGTNSSVFATLICEAAAVRGAQHRYGRGAVGSQRRLQDRRRALAGTERMREPCVADPQRGQPHLVRRGLREPRALAPAIGGRRSKTPY